MEDQIKQIKSLIAKAEQTYCSKEAMAYSQAAVNAANALMTLTHMAYTPKASLKD